jgi:hypothetical protein
LRHHIVIRKVAVRDPIRINFLIRLILTELGPGVCSASSRNEYRKQKETFLGSGARRMHKADNFIAICEEASKAYYGDNFIFLSLVLIQFNDEEMLSAFV